MSKRKLRQDKSGLTLVEIILAMAILAIISVFVLTILTGGIATIYNMGRRTKALNEKAQMYMDHLFVNYGDAEDMIEKDPLAELDVQDYDWQGSGMKLVQVTVTYSSGPSVRLSGLVP